MDQKKILIVSHLIFPTQTPRAHRTTELAKELARQGHEVVIYALLGTFDYTDFEIKHNLKVFDLGNMIFEKSTSDNSRKQTLLDRILVRLLKKIVDFPSIELMWQIPKALKHENSYDLLISIAVPYSIHFGCANALKKNPMLTKVWVADCGDPLMGNQFTKFPFYFKYLEKWLCKKVNHLTVPTENVISSYYPEFRNKIRVIPQGFSLVDINHSINFNKNPVPTFAYAGNFYKGKRDPSLFLDYLCSLELNFKFVIYSYNDELIRPYYKRIRNKIEFKHIIEREQLLLELSKMDFLINIENLHDYGSPSKIIDYVLTKRPILSIGSNYLDEDKIFDFLIGDYKDQMHIEIEKYNINNVAKQFVALMSNVDQV